MSKECKDLGKDRPAAEISIWSTSTDMAGSEFQRKTYFVELKDGDKTTQFSLQVHADGTIVAVPYTPPDYDYTDYDNDERRCDFCGEYNCYGDCAAEAIADLLGETEAAPRAAIRSVVEAVGIEQAWEMASWAVQCHNEHRGLELPNGQKMRVGSIFLHYANAYGDVPTQWQQSTAEKKHSGYHDNEAATVFTMTTSFLGCHARYLREIEQQTGIAHAIQLRIPLSGKLPEIAIVEE